MDYRTLRITGMKWRQGLLWLASAEKSLVAAYDPERQACEVKLNHSEPVADVCPSEEGLWLVARGGTLGWQLVLWSQEERAGIRHFNCPEGAASGMTLLDGKLWVAHRHNRRLFCLDPKNGRIRWVIPTERETYSPTCYGSELWLVECIPGPLGHWSGSDQARYFFSRYDVAREKVAERLPVPLVPSCMAFDGERFWYAEANQTGCSSIPRAALLSARTH